ncbi:hypothetical protein AB1I63_09630 [Streptococcus pneumoniae]
MKKVSEKEFFRETAITICMYILNLVIVGFLVSRLSSWWLD